MFSDENRCLYRRNPLAEVICQLRFPTILTIESKIPAEFQDAIRDEFPQFQRRQERPAPKLTGAPGKFSLEDQPALTNYQFASADGVWRVNLTSGFLSLTCSRYTCWEDFAKKLDKPLAAFIRIYKPAYYERVGLRYLNFISRRDLSLQGVPFSDLMTPCYLGLLANEEISEGSVSRSSVDSELALRGGCRLKLHAGPGLVKRNGQPDNEVKFVLDLDLYMPGQVPINHSAGALQTIHSQAFPIFRHAITDTLHDAMEPEPVEF